MWLCEKFIDTNEDSTLQLIFVNQLISFDVMSKKNVHS